MGSEAQDGFVMGALEGTFDGIVAALSGTLRVGDGFRVHICPTVPFELFCGVWLTDPARDEALAADLPGLVAEVEGAGVPCSIFLPADGYPSSRHALATMGFAGDDVQATMALGVRELAAEAAPIPGLSVSEVEDDAGLGVALRVAAAGFGAPEEVLAPLYEPSIASHPGAAIYVGSVGGTAVSTGVGYVVGDAVGVYSVATPQEHRRRGYGGAIVRRIVTDGFRRGATRAYLLASPDGAGVYRRVGFRPVGEYHLLVRTAGSEPA